MAANACCCTRLIWTSLHLYKLDDSDDGSFSVKLKDIKTIECHYELEMNRIDECVVDVTRIIQIYLEWVKLRYVSFILNEYSILFYTGISW